MTFPFAIVADGLSRNYAGRRVLGPLDLAIESGRVVALIGPNGAGKTTLLKLIMGLIAPSAGHVRLLGHDARELPADAAALVAWVGEGHEPPRWVSLRWLMRLQAEAAAWFHTGRAEELLAERGLSPGQRFGRLSKGQRRWSLASLALASRPDALIFDEPADGLDPNARRRLYDLVRQDVNDRGSTTLIATHILADIERIADDVIILTEGCVRLHEELETLREQVRELELPVEEAAAASALLDADTEQLCRRQIGDVQRLLLRRRSRRPTDFWPAAGSTASVRPVDLGTLYTALTNATPHASAVTANGREVRR